MSKKIEEIAKDYNNNDMPVFQVFVEDGDFVLRKLNGKFFSKKLATEIIKESYDY